MSRSFSRFELSIPSIGLGTWELRGRKCRRVVREALELGYRHIDTAAMYENESEVGSGIVDSGVDRKEVFLTTKINTIEVNNEGIVDAFHKSLSDLKTDYVDLLLIHWPTFSTNLGDMLEIMYGIKESKKARGKSAGSRDIQSTRGLCFRVNKSMFSIRTLSIPAPNAAEHYISTGYDALHIFVAGHAAENTRLRSFPL